MNEELANGYFSTPADFATKAKAKGYRWVAFQWNDDSGTNPSRGPALKAACAAQDIVFTIWMTRGFTAAQARQACVESGAEGFIAEAEIPAENAPGVPKPEAQNWAELDFELQDLPIAKGVATNFAPFTHHDGTPWPEKAKVLVDGNWACLPESYLSESPGSTPEALDFFASHFGWTQTQPILGLYGGKTWSDYPTRDQYRNWSVWDSGSVL